MSLEPSRARVWRLACQPVEERLISQAESESRIIIGVFGYMYGISVAVICVCVHACMQMPGRGWVGLGSAGFAMSRSVPFGWNRGGGGGRTVY